MRRIQRHEGLGDYIHYSRQQFLKHGISRKGCYKLTNSDYNRTFMELRALVMNTLGPKITNIQDIENYLNSLLSSSNANTAITPSGITQAEFSNLIEESLNEVFADYEIDPKTLEIKGNNALKHRESKRIQHADTFHYVKTFDKTFKDLKAIINNTTPKPGEKITSEKILKNHNQAKAYMKKLGEIIKSSRRLSKTGKSMVIDSKYTDIFLEDDQSKTLLQKINSFISAASREIAIYQTGMATEYFVQAALWAAEGSTKEEVKQLLKALLFDKKIKSKGKTSLSSFIEVNAFVDANSVQDIIKGLNTTHHIFSDGNVMFEDGATIETKASFQTVDASYTPTNKFSLWGQEIRASLKSYKNLDNNVHIVSDASAAVILSLVNSRFANHYLNLCVTQYDGNGSDATPAPPLPFGSRDEDVFHLAAAARALIGVRGKAQAANSGANLLIVNNRSNRDKPFRVLSNHDLYSDIYKDPQKYVHISKNIRPGSLSNPWVVSDTNNYSSASQRISKIIANLHQHKLSVSLTPATFIN